MISNLSTMKEEKGKGGYTRIPKELSYTSCRSYSLRTRCDAQVCTLHSRLLVNSSRGSFFLISLPPKKTRQAHSFDLKHSLLINTSSDLSLVF